MLRSNKELTALYLRLVFVGKTTLLNVLAGQLPQNQRLTLSGAVNVNGVPIAHSTHGQGYVQQEDIFYSQLTVKCVAHLACDRWTAQQLSWCHTGPRAAVLSVLAGVDT